MCMFIFITKQINSHSRKQTSKSVTIQFIAEIKKVKIPQTIKNSTGYLSVSQANSTSKKSKTDAPIQNAAKKKIY